MHHTARHVRRLAARATVSSRLSSMSDHRLGDVAAAAHPLGSGIGGRSAELDVDGTRVFVKRVPLTDIESRPENARSTANLFGLPMFYQYGVGSAGFGAWRELAVHVMTTDWVLRDEYAGFPLMYHWRVLPDSPPEGFVDEFGGIDGAVSYWEGNAAVRGRLEAIGRSSYSLVLFLEHLPGTLAEWLGGRRDAPASQTDGEGLSYAWVDDSLGRGAAFMSSRGLVHFDAHFANILTDGDLLCFADFGLALSTDFELSADETAFLADHLAYDRCYIGSHLLHRHLLEGRCGERKHRAVLSEWAEGRRADDVSAETAAIIDRHAGTALVLDEFHRRLLTESKRTPFPTAQLARALAEPTTRANRPSRR
ncbi:protein kinase family protein [Streptomyces sp. NPDC003032]